MKSGFKLFTPSELITLVYAITTCLLVFITWNKLENPVTLTLTRVGVVAAIFVLAYWSKNSSGKVLWFVRNVLILGLIIHWYPETYFLGKGIMEPIDQVFMNADQYLFGCQPSMEFSKLMPQSWFNELMNFGYFSYFFMILGTGLYFYIKRRELSQHTIFIVLCSFFIYYLVFVFIPVMGPQFYFPSPDNAIPDAGVFRYLVKLTQTMGEQPTGAFPSSHVGICIVNLMLLYKYARKGFYALLPIALILFCSTVYIKAHYLIDVFAGIVTAPLFFWLSMKLWMLINSKLYQSSLYNPHGGR